MIKHTVICVQAGRCWTAHVHGMNKQLPALFTSIHSCIHLLGRMQSWPKTCSVQLSPPGWSALAILCHHSSVLWADKVLCQVPLYLQRARYFAMTERYSPEKLCDMDPDGEKRATESQLAACLIYFAYYCGGKLKDMPCVQCFVTKHEAS